jgi:DNA-binding transcriptional LysR family regulator
MDKHAQTGWDDVLFVLAVADHGSVAAAARALDVNHATVLRRIAAFETRQGIRIFDRTPRGYAVSADRRGLIEAMRSAGDSLARVDRLIDAERPRLTGGLRITTTDSIAFHLLAPILTRASQELDAHIEVRASNTHLDFGRMEADITVRPALQLPPELQGIEASVLRFAVFAASPDVTGWLGLSGPLARSTAAGWMAAHAGDVRMSADSFMTLAALARQGWGRTLLPDFVGDATPGLVRLEEPEGLGPVPIWVASHVDFARSGRLRRARSLIAKALSVRT